MTPETRRAALAATARVACMVALVGCHRGGEDYASSDSGPVDSGRAEDCEDPGLAECTQGWAVARYAEGADGGALEDCCELLVEEVGYIYECCVVLDWTGPACMAWGPPRPPSVGAQRRAARAAADVQRAARAGVVA